MELKKVNGKLKPDEVSKFNSVLKVLKYTQSGLTIKNLVLNDKKEFVDVSFEINPESFNILVEKLALNRINLELEDEESTKIIEAANQELERGKNKNAFLGWTGGGGDKKESSKEYSFEGISNEGNYEELIRITRDVSATKEQVAMAASKIDYALNNAMEKAYASAIQDSHLAEQGIKRLLHIAGDNNLSLINKNEYKFKAGIQAINICMKHKEHNPSLILICNNAKIDNLLSITAAVRLSGILNESSYKDHKLLDVVKKELNIKWLKSIFGGVSHKFEENEIKDFKKLIKYVEENRS